MKMIKYMYMCIKHLYVSFSLSVCLMKCNNISCIHFMNFKLVKLNFKSTYFRQIFAERISVVAILLTLVLINFGLNIFTNTLLYLRFRLPDLFLCKCNRNRWNNHRVLLHVHAPNVVPQREEEEEEMAKAPPAYCCSYNPYSMVVLTPFVC